eukprot:2460189-Prymnesium_polylepis.1
MESAHCVIFSSTMHEQMRFWKYETCSDFTFFSAMNALYSAEARKRWQSARRLHGSVRRSCSSNVTLPPSALELAKRRTFLPPVVCLGLVVSGGPAPLARYLEHRADLRTVRGASVSTRGPHLHSILQLGVHLLADVEQVAESGVSNAEPLSRTRHQALVFDLRARHCLDEELERRLPFLLSRDAAVEVLLDEGGHRVHHHAVALRRFLVAERVEDGPHLRPLQHVGHNHHRLVEGAGRRKNRLRRGVRLRDDVAVAGRLRRDLLRACEQERCAREREHTRAPADEHVSVRVRV